MTLHDIVKMLDARILSGTDRLEREICSAFAADVMSDLLTFGNGGSLLLTRMTSPQVVRTSEILDIAAIVMVRGNVPTEEVLLLAGHLNIPILSTRYVLFEAAGRLYEMGLRGLIEKVDPEQTIG